MTIVNPKPSFSESDRQIISLIANKIMMALDSQTLGANAAKAPVVLDEKSSSELLDLLEQLVSKREFLEKVYFVDAVGFHKSTEKNWKKLYFSKGTESSIQSTVKWEGFLRRLSVRGRGWSPYKIPDRMEFEHFIKMEKRLFSECNLNPRVAKLLIDYISIRKSAIEEARDFRDPYIRVKKSTIDPILIELRNPFARSGGIAFELNAIAGLLILLSNLGVLFTTRDWSVAGTISSMSGAIIATVGGAKVRKSIDKNSQVLQNRSDSS